MDCISLLGAPAPSFHVFTRRLLMQNTSETKRVKEAYREKWSAVRRLSRGEIALRGSKCIALRNSTGNRMTQESQGFRRWSPRHYSPVPTGTSVRSVRGAFDELPISFALVSGWISNIGNYVITVSPGYCTSVQCLYTFHPNHNTSFVNSRLSAAALVRRPFYLYEGQYGRNVSRDVGSYTCSL